jgi:hypothetical protein
LGAGQQYVVRYKSRCMSAQPQPAPTPPPQMQPAPNELDDLMLDVLFARARRRVMARQSATRALSSDFPTD